MEIKISINPREFGRSILRTLGLGRTITLCVFLLIAIWIVSSRVIESSQPAKVECLYSTQMFSRFGDSAIYLNGKRVHWQKNNDFCQDAPEDVKRLRIE